MYPRYSPDGSTIAFYTSEGIRFIPSTGEPVAFPIEPPLPVLNPDEDMDAGFFSWSPDGTSIANDANHLTEIHARRLYPGGEPIPGFITLLRCHEVGLARCYDPAYSPGGSKIAFIGEREGPADAEVYEMPSTGGLPLLQLTDNEYHDAEPDYSPDGRNIVVSRRQPPLPPDPFKPPGYGPWHIIVVSLGPEGPEGESSFTYLLEELVANNQHWTPDWQSIGFQYGPPGSVSTPKAETYSGKPGILPKTGGIGSSSIALYVLGACALSVVARALLRRR